MRDNKKYEVRMLCYNCGNAFNVEVPVGNYIAYDDVYGSYYTKNPPVLQTKNYSKPFECPHCLTTALVKQEELFYLTLEEK